LHLQPKWCHYERHYIPPIPQTYDIRHTSHSLTFASRSDTGSTLTVVQVPAISFMTSKSDSKNTTHQSNNNNNNTTTPYPTIWPRPLLWPIKYLDQNWNQHQHNSRITLARETMRQWRPSWPNQPHRHHIASRPIILIPPMHPPPWPIIFHHSNHQNTKHRLRTKFQRISKDIFLLFTYLPFQY
jgi:hypothetical protein